MTLTFDEAYAELDSIVESAMLDLEIADLQEAAADEDYYDDYDLLDEATQVQKKDPRTGKPVFDKDGKPVMVTIGGSLDTMKPEEAAAQRQHNGETYGGANSSKLDPLKPATDSEKKYADSRKKKYARQDERQEAKDEKAANNPHVTIARDEEKTDNELQEEAKRRLVADGLPVTKTNVNMYVAKIRKETRQANRTERYAEDTNDNKFKAFAKTVARGIVKIFQIIAKAFKKVKEFFIKLGKVTFRLSKPTVKGAVDYTAISSAVNNVNTYMKKLDNKSYNKMIDREEANEGKTMFEACNKVVPAGTIINAAAVAKCAAYSENVADNYAKMAERLETGANNLEAKSTNGPARAEVGNVREKATILRAIAEELKDFSAKSVALMGEAEASADKSNAATRMANAMEKGRAAGQKAGKVTSTQRVLERQYKAAPKNEAAEILLSQAQSLLAEGAIDDAYTLMDTAKSLMVEGAEEYTEGLGADLTMSEDDRCDEFDSEVSQDEYDSDVVGGEGQDPDDDIKEVLGGNSTALALMTDDEGNETVHEEVEIIL